MTGVGAGGGGGTGGTATCSSGSGDMLGSGTFGPVSQRNYGGPAVVERSTSSDLVFSFEQPSLEAGKPAVVLHVNVGGLSPMPRLAVGTTVWLQQSVPPPPVALYLPQPGRWLRVLDKEGGRLLLGYSMSYDGDTSGSPLPFAGAHAGCVERNTWCDSPAAQRIWQALEVTGDTNVTLQPGEPAKVTLGGVDYDAVAVAYSETTGNGSCAADYRPAQNVTVSAIARDLGALTADLPKAEPPSCSLYNDAQSTESFGLLGVSLNTPYAGPVVYRSSAAPDGWLRHRFDTPGLQPQFPDSELGLELDDWSKDFTPPAAGTTLYYESYGGDTGALFSKQGGAPLLVAANGTFDQALMNQLGSWLGVSVALQQSCEYTTLEVNNQPTPFSLSQVTLGTEPPVTVHSGERSKLKLAGHDYEAYVGSTDGNRFVLRAL